MLRAHLSREQGVRDLAFDIFQGRMTVSFDGGMTSESRIQQAVLGIGMGCERWSSRAASEPETRGGGTAGAWVWASGLTLAAALTVHSVLTGEVIQTLLAHGHGIGSPAEHDHATPWPALGLYVASLAAAAVKIGPRAWTSLRNRQANMDLLVAVSLLGAGVLGEWAEAGTLGFLFVLAGRLESWSLERARGAITRLLRVAPPRATVVHHDHEHETEVERIQPGTLVRVGAGERIPVDGRIESGSSFVNQALITGESVAVEKGPGAGVYAGTINEDAPLWIRASAHASDTVLARMIRMVERSQSRRAGREQLIERIAARYTPAVLALAAALAFLPPLSGGGAWSDWAYQGVMVLLVACPCALVISTPVTMMAALTSAARAGVLVKGTSFLEEAAGVRTLLGPERLLESWSWRRGPVKLQPLVETSAEGRTQRVEEEQRDGAPAAYVGETADDAAAVAAASVGIALAAPGSDLAQEAADIVVLRGGGRSVEFLFSHARRTMRVVASNIAIAIAMKAMFLAAIATGRATLWMAVAADMGATLLVTFNGLRLLRAGKMKE